MPSSWKYVVCFIFGVQVVLAQVAFPEPTAIDKEKDNLNGRIPLYAPSVCKKHELLYPGDLKDDWICDCAPAAVYYPESDACFPAFRQGPCQDGELLILFDGAILPQCLKNDCKVDGQVKIRNVCYELGKIGPCQNPEMSYVLGVDPKTMHVDCVKLSINFESRIGEASPHSYNLTAVELCPRGCKRAIQGRCPERVIKANTLNNNSKKM